MQFTYHLSSSCCVCVCVFVQTVFNIHIRATTARDHRKSISHFIRVLANQFSIIHYSIVLKTRIGMWRTVEPDFHLVCLKKLFKTYCIFQRTGDHVPYHIWCELYACTRHNDRCKIIQLLLSNHRARNPSNYKMIEITKCKSKEKHSQN